MTEERRQGCTPERLVELLKDDAVEGETGCYWLNRPEALDARERAAFPHGSCSLGLAHGMAGVISLLSLAHAAGIAPVQTADLIEHAVSFLLAQRKPGSDYLCFPTYVTPSGARRVQRAAWCHGGPGIASALVLAGRSLGRAAWVEVGIELACHAAAIPEERTGVLDAAICHGTAGIMHILNRLFHATGDPRLRSAARLWAERTLHQRSPGAGIGGYRSRPPDLDGRPRWHSTPGLLQGGAGIALALLAAASRVEPNWDRVLLLS